MCKCKLMKLNVLQAGREIRFSCLCPEWSQLCPCQDCVLQSSPLQVLRATLDDSAYAKKKAKLESKAALYPRATFIAICSLRQVPAFPVTQFCSSPVTVSGDMRLRPGNAPRLSVTCYCVPAMPCPCLPHKDCIV